jgi:hypothetical protein
VELGSKFILVFSGFDAVDYILIMIDTCAVACKIRRRSGDAQHDRSPDLEIRCILDLVSAAYF